MDFVSPAGFDHAVDGALDKKIAKMEEIKDAGVIDRDRRLKGHSRA